MEASNYVAMVKQKDYYSCYRKNTNISKNNKNYYGNKVQGHFVPMDTKSGIAMETYFRFQYQGFLHYKLHYINRKIPK